MKQKDAKIRVCASCEWIFTDKRHPKTDGCPKCGFAHYGARYVYGDKAYRYAITHFKFGKCLFYMLFIKKTHRF